MAIYLNEEKEDLKKTPLSDEETDSVNGGIIHLYHPTCKFEVINDETGDVMGTFEYDDLEGAKQFARENGVKDTLVASSYVFEVRSQYQEKQWWLSQFEK